jgi:hypothetical protein
VEGVERVKKGGRASPPSASWAKNILTTEHKQKRGDLQPMCIFLVCWGDNESVDV